jgi:hypothetical protein
VLIRRDLRNPAGSSNPGSEHLNPLWFQVILFPWDACPRHKRKGPTGPFSLVPGAEDLGNTWSRACTPGLRGRQNGGHTIPNSRSAHGETLRPIVGENRG